MRKTTIRYECPLCHRQNRAEQAVFSSHTRNRYCADDAACDRRSRVRSKRRKVVAA